MSETTWDQYEPVTEDQHDTDWGSFETVPDPEAAKLSIKTALQMPSLLNRALNIGLQGVEPTEDYLNWEHLANQPAPPATGDERAARNFQQAGQAAAQGQASPQNEFSLLPIPHLPNPLNGGLDPQTAAQVLGIKPTAQNQATLGMLGVPESNTLAGYGSAAANTGADFAKFMGTPEGLATGALASTGPLGGSLVGSYYLGKTALQGVPEAAQRAGTASVTGTPQEQKQAYTDLAANILGGAALGHGIYKMGLVPKQNGLTRYEPQPGEPFTDISEVKPGGNLLTFPEAKASDFEEVPEPKPSAQPGAPIVDLGEQAPGEGPKVDLTGITNPQESSLANGSTLPDYDPEDVGMRQRLKAKKAQGKTHEEANDEIAAENKAVHNHINQLPSGTRVRNKSGTLFENVALEGKAPDWVEVDEQTGDIILKSVTSSQNLRGGKVERLGNQNSENQSPPAAAPPAEATPPLSPAAPEASNPLQVHADRSGADWFTYGQDITNRSMAGKGQSLQIMAEQQALAFPDEAAWAAGLEKSEAEQAALFKKLQADPGIMMARQNEIMGLGQKSSFFREGLKILRNEKAPEVVRPIANETAPPAATPGEPGVNPPPAANAEGLATTPVESQPPLAPSAPVSPALPETSPTGAPAPMGSGPAVVNPTPPPAPVPPPVTPVTTAPREYNGKTLEAWFNVRSADELPKGNARWAFARMLGVENKPSAILDALRNDQGRIRRRISEIEKPFAPEVSPAAPETSLSNRILGHWRQEVEPALHDFFRAANQFGVERLERNHIKPPGMSLSDWLEKVTGQNPSAMGLTGIQMLSQRDLWPTEGPEGENLRTNMLAAVRALKGAPGRRSDWIRNQEFSATQRSGTPETKAPIAETKPASVAPKAPEPETKPIQAETPPTRQDPTGPAAEKVQTEVSAAADTQGKRAASDVKKDIIAKVQSELEKLPALNGEVAFSDPKTYRGQKQITARTTGDKAGKYVTIRQAASGDWSVVHTDVNPWDKFPVEVSQTVTTGKPLQEARDIAREQLLTGNLWDATKPITRSGKELTPAESKKLRLEFSKATEEVSFDIPGNGSFTIPKTHYALNRMLARAKALSTSPEPPKNFTESLPTRAEGRKFAQEAQQTPTEPKPAPSTGTPPALGNFPKASEAQGLGEQTGPPTIEDVRRSRQTPSPGQRVVIPPDAPKAAPIIFYSGIPLPPTVDALKDLVRPLGSGTKAVRAFVREAAMKQLPRISDASHLAGEAGVRSAWARDVAVEKGIKFANDVLGDLAKEKGLDLKLGAGISEDNLRHLKDRNLKLVEEVNNREELIQEAREELENWLEADREGDAEAKTNVNQLRQRIARLQEYTDEDAQKFQDLADGTYTFIGQPGSPFKTEADYRSFMESAKGKELLARHRALWREIKDPIYRMASDVDPGVPLEGRGLDYGARINLKPIYDEADAARTAKGGSGGGTLTKPLASLKKRNPFKLRAEGQGPAYEGSYTELMANAFKREYPVAAQHEFIQTMIDEGLAKATKAPNPEGLLLNGETTIGRKLTLRPWSGSYLQVPKSMASEYDAGIGMLADQTIPGYTAVGKAMTWLSTSGIAEGSTHVANVLSEMFTGPGPTGHPLLNALLKAAGRADILYRLPWVLMRGFSDNRDEMLSLMERGMAKTPYRGLLVAPFLNGIDRGMRLTMASVYDDLVKNGWAEDTETAKREFINKLGNYKKELQPLWIRTLRTTHVQPFATAIHNFNVQGLRSMTGRSGVKAAGHFARLALMAETAAGLLGVAVAVGIINYLLSGRPDGPQGTRLLNVGWIGDDGKLHQFDVGALTGWSRGPRVTGLQGYLESKRQGLNESQSQMNAARSVGNAALSYVSGPLNTVATIAATGERPGVKFGPNDRHLRVAPVQAPQQNYDALKSQLVANIAAALRSTTPAADAVASMLEGKSAEDIMQRQATRYMPKTGMKTETIANLPKIVTGSEIHAYSDSLGAQARRLPLNQRWNFVAGEMNKSQVPPEMRSRIIMDLRKAGTFSYQ